ncbi:hypothetical protein AOLI_G00330260 [Acnodon oligacanthus]
MAGLMQNMGRKRFASASEARAARAAADRQARTAAGCGLRGAVRVVYHSGKEAEDSHSPPQSNTHPGLPIKPSNKVRERQRGSQTSLACQCEYA